MKMKSSSAVSKISVLALLTLGALGFVACGTSTESSSTSARNDRASSTGTSEATDGMPHGGVLDLNKIIGQTESQANSVLKGGGYSLRVIERDGEVLATTKDFRPNRVNVIVQDGKIVRTAGFY